MSAQIEEKRKLIAGTNKFIEEFDENVKEILLTINKEKTKSNLELKNFMKNYFSENEIQEIITKILKK